MAIQARAYAGLDDLKRMKALLVEGRKAASHSGYMHTGDVDWWLFYSGYSKLTPPHEIVQLGEENGELVAWLIFDPVTPNFDPPAPGYDLVIHPRLRGTATHVEWMNYAEQQLMAWSPEKSAIQTFMWEGDRVTCGLLEARGYTEADFLTFFSRSLAEIPDPILPEGFRFLERMQPEWVDRRAEAHFHAFNPSRMTVESYRHFMTAPDYDPELDVVVAAPDGRFASFAMCWIDPETGIGSFEPVGTRAEFQRHGLGRAAMLEGMRRMRARGMTTATVMTWARDEGNLAFYQSLGFEQTDMLRKYTKQLKPHGT